MSLFIFEIRKLGEQRPGLPHLADDAGRALLARAFGGRFPSSN